MTLTFKLVRDIMNVNVYANFQVHRSNDSAARVHSDRQTHGHTGPRTLPLLLMREVKIIQTRAPAHCKLDCYQKHIHTFEKDSNLIYCLPLNA